MTRINHTIANDCPWCGAVRGEWCKTPSGVKVRAHAVRPRGLILADLTPAALREFEKSGADPFETEVLSPTEWVVGRNEGENR